MRAPRRDRVQHPARHESALHQRMADLEKRITDQQDELSRLRQTLADQQATPAQAAEPGAPVQPVQWDSGKRLASRRTLLKLGGAAAAAGVATVAANVAMKQNVAFAAGTAWQTGTVNADTNTIVQPASSGYSASNILQLQLGTGSVFAPSTLKAALAAYDTTTNNVGVYGSSSTGYGLFGRTDSGAGAHGAGLNGTANGTGTGVEGLSQSGIGVQGNSASGIGGSFSGGQAPLLLAPAVVAGPPTSGTHVQGEVYTDANGIVWVCSVSGDFGTSSPPAFYRLSSLQFLPAPMRLLDTRSGQPAADSPGAPIGPNGTFHLPVAGVTYGGSSIPSGATGVFGNITLGTGSQNGNLIFYPDGGSVPNANSIAFTANAYVSNFTGVGIGGNGKVAIFNQSNGSTNLTFDAFAYII